MRPALTVFLVYLDPVSKGYTEWPVDVLVDGVPDIENITEALREGPYGRCVYESDNNVCDNQVCPPLSVPKKEHRTELTLRMRRS